ncbi:hypothetical protein TYRP_018319 [Tyrophagus putrescentiae]|nr:hypothetical protein TYRP_018319 [Tyrophagus putrescentiae]
MSTSVRVPICADDNKLTKLPLLMPPPATISTTLYCCPVQPIVSAAGAPPNQTGIAGAGQYNF